MSLSRLFKKSAQLEKQIEDLEKRKTETETKLADSSIYSNPAKLNEINRFYTDIKQKIAEATDEWEKTVLEADALEIKDRLSK